MALEVPKLPEASETEQLGEQGLLKSAGLQGMSPEMVLVGRGALVLMPPRSKSKGPGWSQEDRTAAGTPRWLCSEKTDRAPTLQGLTGHPLCRD